MRHLAGILAVALVMAGATMAQAGTDDDKWIKRCISDNADEGQTPEVLGVYCSCMNENMSSDETLSISAWEKKNPEVQEKCSKRAKWRS